MLLVDLRSLPKYIFLGIGWISPVWMAGVYVSIGGFKLRIIRIEIFREKYLG